MDKYGEQDARTILGGIGTESYFGGMDLDTAQNISGRLGSAFHLDRFKPSQGLHEKALLRPDELIRYLTMTCWCCTQIVILCG